MESVGRSGNELSVEERKLLSVAYKNAVGSRRAARRITTSVELEETSKGNDGFAARAREYRDKVDDEVQKLCITVVGLLERSLIPKASDGESAVFYLQMKAGFHRHIAESTAGEAKAKAVCCTEAAYAAAAAVAEVLLAVTHPIRLGLALHYSVFLYEVQLKPEEACKWLHMAIEAAFAELDNVREDLCKDSTLIMQLMGDSLALWKDGLAAMEL
jgi:14-3-3 protein epsilon